VSPEVKNLTVAEPTPKKAEPKPGLKTTEFWLALIVTAGVAVATVYEDQPWARIVGLVAAALTSAGYGLSRAIAKK
jgi:hypothetical protein